MTWIKRWGISIAVSAAVSAAAPAIAAAAIDDTWSGSTSMSNWTTAGNWSHGEPSGSIGLIFPDLNGVCSSPDTCYTSSDDIGGALSINQLSIDDTDGYFIQNGGDSPSLSIGAGGIEANATADSTGNSATISVPLVLAAPQTWTFGGTVNPTDDYQGQLDLGGGVSGGGTEALTLTATGLSTTLPPPVLEINGEESNLDSEVGPITVENGVNLQLALEPELNTGDVEPIDVSGAAQLSVTDGPAETGPVNITDGTLAVGAGGSPDGSLAVTGNVTLDASSLAYFFIDDNGSAPSTDYTQLSATGNIALGGSGLLLQQGVAAGDTCVTLTTGDSATLVSDPTGTISGTFADVPNGVILPMIGCGDERPVQIAYTAHAVTATVLSRATTTTLSAPSSATATKPVTMTATVTGAGTPTGTVAFSDGGAPISGCGGVALTQGTGVTSTATCTTSFTGAGAHTITATYGGSAIFDGSTSGARTLQVSATSTSPPVPPAGSGTPKVNGAQVTTTTTGSGTPEVSVPVSCASGGASCTVKGMVTGTEKVRGGKGHKAKKKTVVLGSATITIAAGKSGRVSVKLNGTGRKLLASHHSLRVKLTVTHRVNGKTKTLLTKFITLKLRKAHKK